LILQKQFKNHFGLDLNSSNIDRPDHFASEILNAQYAKSGTIQKRKGFKAKASSIGGHGLFTYKKIEPSTSFLIETLVSVSDKLHKLNEASIAITYAGAEPVSILNMYFKDSISAWVLEISHETLVFSTIAMGIGFDEASIYKLSDLNTAINALTGYSSVITGLSTTPASFLDNVSNFDLITGGTCTLKANYWSDVNSPLSTPFSESETNKNSVDFENVSFTQLNNILLISNGYDQLQKYDGQTCYRAGLPLGPIPTLTNGAAGLITAGTYVYKTTYEQVDAVLNTIQGDESGGTITIASSLKINVQVNNILAASGYNTACGIVNGNQTSVNIIAVNDGGAGQNTFNVGDKAYFYDTISLTYVTRNITARTSTNITVDGAVVSVLTGQVISNNLKICIYRSENSGTSTFLSEKIPNNSFTANQTYVDNKTDALLGVEYLIPIKSHGPPPKGKYITPYYNQLIITGSIDFPNIFFWSDIESPEYFPIGDNFELAQSFNGDSISGAKQSNEVLCIFESNCTHVYAGDFLNNNISHEITSHSIGCASFHSIAQVEQEIVFLSNKGVYSIVSGQIPQEQSKLIQPDFMQNSSILDSEKFVLKRSIGYVDILSERYLLLIPTESLNGSNKYCNDNYKVLILDYSHNYHQEDIPKVWLKWNLKNTNFVGGIAKYNDRIFFSERRYSVYNSSVDHVLYSFLNNNTTYDYADNVSSTEFLYKTAWYSMGEPSVFKYYNRLKLFYIPENLTSDVILSVETEKDYTEGLQSNVLTVNLIGGGQGYGSNAYSDSPYGDITQPNVKTKLGGKFKSMRINFSNSEIHRGIEITGWELEASGPFRKEIKE